MNTEMMESTAQQESQAGAGPESDEHGVRPDVTLATPFASVRFYICLAILIVSAIGIPLAAKSVGAFLHKEKLSLQKPLFELDQTRLLPDFELHPVQPPPLDDDTLANLGTKEYLNWRLIARRRKPSDPGYLSWVFVTYFTGQPDMVPHRPEECRAAGGSILKHSEVTRIEVKHADGNVKIPIRVLEFEPPTRHGVTPGARMFVLYFFYTNGRYVTTRQGVKDAVWTLRDRFAYYSKIEMSFSNNIGQPANREQSIAAAKLLLGRLMPVLWDDHFQDWGRIKSGGAPIVRE